MAVNNVRKYFNSNSAPRGTLTLNPVLRGAVRLEDGYSSRKRFLTAGHIIRRIVRDQGSGSVPDGRRGRHRGPVVRLAPHDFRVHQLVQLVPDVRVHPTVYNRVGHRRRHGG